MQRIRITNVCLFLKVLMKAQAPKFHKQGQQVQSLTHQMSLMQARSCWSRIQACLGWPLPWMRAWGSMVGAPCIGTQSKRSFVHHARLSEGTKRTNDLDVSR